jgi:ubiquinol-cytochrome c reductase cytochrome b subunit
MLRRFGDWLDARVGHRRVCAAFRERVLPNGPSWWYTSASCLFWLLVIQGVTGLLLMATYSPSMTSAWASVHYIDQSAAGRFLRGVHHFAAHAMIILFVVHVARVLVSAAFRAPRELVWITGLLLIPLIIIWTVTGNPLSGSQTGIAQIEVEGNILASTPVIGPALRRLLIGGEEVGNLTLTHLYFLHVGLLPLLVGLLCALHLHQVYKHSPHRAVSTSEAEGQPAGVPYWPYQTFRNLVVLAAVTGVIAWLAWTRGAPLAAPADPDLPQTPRPEWYFRWLFELRRHFTGEWEFVATIVLPAAILAFFLFLPLLDRWLSRRVGLLFRVAVVVGSVGGWGWLTYNSLSRDWRDPEYLAAREQSAEFSTRARELADTQHITVAGAARLLQQDAKTRGPLLFAKHCASCHPYVNEQGAGIAAAEPSAPNLYGFGTPDWIMGLLDRDRITSPQVYGATKFSEGDMVGKVQELFDGAGEEGTDELRGKLRQVAAALSAEAGLPAGRGGVAPDEADVAHGRELITGEFSCTDCHRFGDTGDLGSAPDLTGYGSREWLAGMISDPAGERFYPSDLNDRMPAFCADAEHPETNLLSPSERDLLVDWLRGEWFEPSPPAESASPPPANIVVR